MRRASVRLRPLREDEFAAWLAEHVDWYAGDIAAHGGMPAYAARRKAEADTKALWPQGFATPGSTVLAVEADGIRVGSIWFAPREHHGVAYAYLYAIVLDDRHRGKGLGREAMRLLEAEVKARGLGRIELNVFAGNDVARGLYRALGYEETAVHMAKDVE